MISLKSKIALELLNYFFMQEGSSLYVNEMSRLFKSDRGNLIKKLKILENEGILKSEFRGNQKYYSLNKKYPVLDEYRKIILKTVGFEKKIKTLLNGVTGIKTAYLFGSYAKNKMDLSSDIDLIVIGTQDTIRLQREISKLQSLINREINVISMGPKEFQEKIKKKDAFVIGITKDNAIKLI